MGGSGHRKEVALPRKACQCSGRASQGKDGDWTWYHIVALCPQPSFSRVELLGS